MMNTSVEHLARMHLPLLLAGALVASASSTFAQASSQSAAPSSSQEVAAPSKAPPQEQGMPELPKTPALVAELVEAIPFELVEPFVHSMRSERPEYTRGHVLIIRAPQAYLVPRQVAEPVLIVGGQTAERINTGAESGLLVVVVPEWRERGTDGIERAGNPTTARVYFASPELPERVDAAWIEREGRKADAAGLEAKAPMSAGFAIAKARSFADRDALGRMLADLVERHAPRETDCIDALRATN